MLRTSRSPFVQIYEKIISSRVLQIFHGHKEECVLILNLLVIFFLKQIFISFLYVRLFFKVLINRNSVLRILKLFIENNTTIGYTNKHQVIIFLIIQIKSKNNAFMKLVPITYNTFHLLNNNSVIQMFHRMIAIVVL